MNLFSNTAEVIIESNTNFIWRGSCFSEKKNADNVKNILSFLSTFISCAQDHNDSDVRMQFIGWTTRDRSQIFTTFG